VILLTFQYYRNYLINLRKIVKCGICGHKQKLQFHHIKSTKLNGVGRGLDRRARDILRNPECYIPLCYFCHKKVTSFEYIIIWNPISEYLGWYYTGAFELELATEADLKMIKVI